MEICEMNMDDIQKRFSEIETEIPTVEDEERKSVLLAEMDKLDERKAELRIEAEKAEKRNAVANGEGEIVKDSIVEARKMKTIEEFRNEKVYIDAYAEYIKSADDTEIRSLLTNNVEAGTIAVPTMVLDIVKTAWEKEEIMALVPKTSVKGNLKVQFEISGDDAVIHTEGSGAVSEETLTEGIVTIVPANIKKWISISDEVMAMRGEAFLNYIYSELTYRITKKMADQLISLIVALPSTATATSVAADVVSENPAMSTVATAISHLSDEASAPVIVMNKLTWAEFKKIQYANNYGVDPFEGLTVKFNNSIKAYSAASAGDVYMIVGDFSQGALANFPEGDGIKLVFDELTRKKEDLVEVLGREYVGLGIIANKSFVNVKKVASAG